MEAALRPWSAASMRNAPGRGFASMVIDRAWRCGGNALVVVPFSSMKPLKGSVRLARRVLKRNRI
jgi:hypothetical protein